MSPLPRGFKTWSERFSASLRQDLGLASTDPLPPAQLAEYLEVRLLTPRDVPGVTQDVLDQLLVHDHSGWSAVTQEVNGITVVIYNSRHSRARQASDICHELAHLLLEHTPGRVTVSVDGSVVMRSYDAKQEDEANWLAWAVLLPRAALLDAKRSGMTVPQIAEQFGVSEVLVRFRMRICGVDAQVRAAQSYAKRRRIGRRP